jgi:DNA polymerase-3 subunit alpha
MTTELTNTPKLREFVEELKRLNIKIIRPSINRCFAEFKAVEKKIYYGLGAIKSVGFEAISNIVKEREKNGEYKNLFDFMNRVDAKNVNKLQLEGLVKAGVFDEFDKDRNKILTSIPRIIQKIKNINDDKDSNQSNLFEKQDSEKNDFEFLPSELWVKKELLSEEFKSLGFYLSDHPLNEYEEVFNHLKIIPYNKFYNNDEGEGVVAGTIMSIQEKKSAKGTPYGIVKFSDKKGEFELFLFAEILVANRDKLKESESFILTLQKDKIMGDDTQKRINVRKILSLDDVISKPYSKVTIELKNNYNMEEIRDLLSGDGDTEINFIIKDKNQEAHYSLENNRKFDLEHFKSLKSKEYVTKITV